jgi:hypothetical protein
MVWYGGTTTTILPPPFTLIIPTHQLVWHGSVKYGMVVPPSHTASIRVVVVPLYGMVYPYGPYHDAKRATHTSLNNGKNIDEVNRVPVNEKRKIQQHNMHAGMVWYGFTIPRSNPRQPRAFPLHLFPPPRQSSF